MEAVFPKGQLGNQDSNPIHQRGVCLNTQTKSNRDDSTPCGDRGVLHCKVCWFKMRDRISCGEVSGLKTKGGRTAVYVWHVNVRSCLAYHCQYAVARHREEIRAGVHDHT